MKLSEQVVSLDLAKRLKELGVKQESLFTHTFYKENGFEEIEMRGIIGEDAEHIAAAFTVAELGEMLPDQIEGYDFLTLKMTMGWGCYYREYYYGSCKYIQEAHTEADARAKCLIYLIENKLITV